MDLSSYTIQQIGNLIENYTRQISTKTKLYLKNPEYINETLLNLRAEMMSRTGKGLSFEKSMEVIRKAARDRRFLSYKELADESGAKWTSVHYEIGNHLWELVSFAHGRGWPMLSAIVVNKPNISTGMMEDDALKGFISAARLLGIPVVDDVQFLRDQQEKVFVWAANS